MKRRHYLAGFGTFAATGCLRLTGDSAEADSEATTTDSTTVSQTTTPPDSTTGESESSATETTTDSEPQDDMERLCDGNPIPESVSTTWPKAFFDGANTGHQPVETVAQDKPCIAWKKEVPSRPVFSTVVTEDVVIKGGKTTTYRR